MRLTSGDLGLPRDRFWSSGLEKVIGLVPREYKGGMGLSSAAPSSTLPHSRNRVAVGQDHFPLESCGNMVAWRVSPSGLPAVQFPGYDSFERLTLLSLHFTLRNTGFAQALLCPCEPLCWVLGTQTQTLLLPSESSQTNGVDKPIRNKLWY